MLYRADIDYFHRLSESRLGPEEKDTLLSIANRIFVLTGVLANELGQEREDFKDIHDILKAQKVQIDFVPNSRLLTLAPWYS